MRARSDGSSGAAGSLVAERPQPIHGANRRLHRINPVDAQSRRVRVEPRRQLGVELAQYDRLPEQPSRASERQEVVAAAELPGELRIAAFLRPQNTQIHIRVQRPSRPKVIRVPVDLHPHTRGPPSESVKSCATTASASSRYAVPLREARSGDAPTAGASISGHEVAGTRRSSDTQAVARSRRRRRTGRTAKSSTCPASSHGGDVPHLSVTV